MDALEALHWFLPFSVVLPNCLEEVILLSRGIAQGPQGEFMNLLILGEQLVKSRTNYLGTYRVFPSFHDDLPEHHPINQLYLKYLAAVDEDSFLHDEQIAKEIVDELNSLSNNKYEIVEIRLNEFFGRADKAFLGYDISTGFYSLLSWGLEFGYTEKPTGQQTSPEAAQPMLRLIEAYFYPKLNAFGLFSRYEDAVFCLQCFKTIQKCFPNLLENDEVIFEIIEIRRYQYWATKGIKNGN